MSDLLDDPGLATALRSLPVPTLPPDFDDRVLAALRTPSRRQILTWRRVWQPLQPLLLGTSCSLGLTLLALHLTLNAPQTAPFAVPPALTNLAAAPPAPVPSLDALLDRPDLCAGSLAAWTRATAPDAEEPEEALRRPEPRRRAGVSPRPSLAA